MPLITTFSDMKEGTIGDMAVLGITESFQVSETTGYFECSKNSTGNFMNGQHYQSSTKEKFP